VSKDTIALPSGAYGQINLWDMLLLLDETVVASSMLAGSSPVVRHLRCTAKVPDSLLIASILNVSISLIVALRSIRKLLRRAQRLSSTLYLLAEESSLHKTDVWGSQA